MGYGTGTVDFFNLLEGVFTRRYRSTSYYMGLVRSDLPIVLIYRREKEFGEA